MNALMQQQHRLRDAIVDGASADGLLRGLTAPLLHIYQNAYGTRLLVALRDNYGVLPRAMGDEVFDELSRAYLRGHPSRTPSIRWFGDALPAFMAEHAELVPHPAFIDLARMEWALRDAFDAADAKPLSAETLAALPADAWPSLVLHFQPSLQMLDLNWRIEPAWRALQVTEEEPELDAPAPGEHVLLVWRPALETRWRSASSALEAQLIKAAMRGGNFELLCEVAAAEVGDDISTKTVVMLLQHWLAEGLLRENANALSR